MQSTRHKNQEAIYKRVQSIHLVHLHSGPEGRIFGIGAGATGKARVLTLSQEESKTRKMHLNESQRHSTLNKKLPAWQESTLMADPVKPAYLVPEMEQRQVL